MQEDDQPRIYTIPDNFIDESRIINGMFKTRNFIEGVIMAIIMAIPAMMIPASSYDIRIILLTAFCAPAFFVGVVGYNGDPISTTIKNAKAWAQGRGIMLYNAQSRALKESPLDAMMSKATAGDRIQDVLDSMKEIRDKHTKKVALIEGETFEFEEDAELVDIYVSDADTEENDLRNVNEEPEAQEEELELVGEIEIAPTAPEQVVTVLSEPHEKERKEVVVGEAPVVDEKDFEIEIDSDEEGGGLF